MYAFSISGFQEFDRKPTIFKYDELRLATQGFHTTMKLGEGGFGAVYKVVITTFLKETIYRSLCMWPIKAQQ
jgi:hypothetical protein